MDTSECFRRQVALAAAALFCCAFAGAAEPAVDFDAGAPSLSAILKSAKDAAARAAGPASVTALPDGNRSVPAYWGSDGRWCQDGQVYHGGPCDRSGGWTPPPNGYPPPGPFPPPQPPNGPYPPPYPQPAPTPAGDLRGYCPDPDHSNFSQAKEFAYSGEGLNYDDSGATQWALQFVQTHACGTICEYRARFQALYQYAYSGQYLNLDDNGARSFALQYAETTPAGAVQGWTAQFPAVYDFFYSGSYMNLDSRPASSKADAWVRRGCGDIRPIEDAFARQYQFAYSGTGLNMSSPDAVRYAAGQVAGMTPCSDLFW